MINSFTEVVSSVPYEYKFIHIPPAKAELTTNIELSLSMKSHFIIIPLYNKKQSR